MDYLKKGLSFYLYFHKNQLQGGPSWWIYAWFGLLIFFLSIHAPITCVKIICNITFLLFFRLTSWWNYQIENRMKIQWSQKNIYHVVKTKLTYFITNIYSITISIVIADWDFVIFVFITTSKQSIHNVYLIMCYSKVG